MFNVLFESLKPKAGMSVPVWTGGRYINGQWVQITVYPDGPGNMVLEFETIRDDPKLRKILGGK